MKVLIKIDELVFCGFDHVDSKVISEAMAKELALLARKSEWPTHNAEDIDVPFLDSIRFDMKAEMSIQAIGSEVARSVYRGLRRQAIL
jgi:hypothetical protein